MKWLKPSGVEIETNELEETIDYCSSLGWKPIVDGEAVDIEAEAEKAIEADLDASGTLFDPEKHWKNRAKDKDGNWKTKKAD